MLHQRLQLEQDNLKLQAQIRVSNMGQHCLRFCVTYVGDTRLVEFVLHVLHWKYPKNERNKTRLTLAPNRGCLGVFWAYSGSVVVLPWDLTHNLKHADKHTGTSMSRHTDSSSLDTNYDTGFAPRTYAFAQRPKSDKNIPVNRSPKLLLLPCHFCINFKMFSLNQQGDLLSAPPCHVWLNLRKASRGQ